MKIGVVGTFNRDRILPWKGPETESIGGIFFTVSYLANLVDKASEIYPVCFVGEDFYQQLAEALSAYPNVNLSGIRVSDQKNTQVTLTYTDAQERDEVISQPMPPLQFEQLETLQSMDAVIVNLITGEDVELAALQRFRAHSNALIYLDFHSHALGIDEHGKRYYRRPDDWQEWLRPIDVLQINEMEACTLGGFEKKDDHSNLIAFGKKLVTFGPSICHITLADQGSLLFFLEEANPQFKHITGVEINDAVDIIGCGDAFSAAFTVKYLRDRNVFAATEFANQVAALNCTFVGSSQIKNIWNLIEEFV